MTLEKLVVAKFGGSAIGPFGESIPVIISRINELKKHSKVVAVFSAPLTVVQGQKRSLTDVMLRLGRSAEQGAYTDMKVIHDTYDRIISMVSADLRGRCDKDVRMFLDRAGSALEEAASRREFANETRSRALGFSGELLMSCVMNHILRSNGIKSDYVPFEEWPIITDRNIEFTNFLASRSAEHAGFLEQLVSDNDLVCMGGFIGRAQDGTITTYERGGSDRTAADIAILLHRMYDTRIDFEKDSAVVSADPKLVTEDLSAVPMLSYNEARLAGMFGMKILDPIAIKEILENGVDMPITITDMNNPGSTTTIQRHPRDDDGHPLKIVTGKRNCAILRMEAQNAQNLLESLTNDRRYSEYVVLSPFTRDGTEFTRILFLDADYVKRNEKYMLGFDSLASITYNRGVITLIGDQMWRVQQVASRTSYRIGEAGLNILNMDAQEETSRIIIVVEDSADNIPKAIRTIHAEKSQIQFI